MSETEIIEIIEELVYESGVWPEQTKTDLESIILNDVIMPVYKWWANDKEIQMAGLYEKSDLIMFILKSSEYKTFIRDRKLDSLIN